MSIVKCKIDVQVEIDTDDYPVPSDGKFTTSLEDDVKEVLEANMSLEVVKIKAVKTGGRLHDELRDQDFE